MNTNEKLAQKMYREIQNIYNNYGGYDYNDTMWCQYEKDEDWNSLIKELKPCLEYMRHIKKIRILQESIPQPLYG